MTATVRIKELPQHVGEKVVVNGWLYNKRSSGKLQFPIIRDGSGYLQCVVFKKEVGEETWKAAEDATQESTGRVIGTVREESRAPGGVRAGLLLRPDVPCGEVEDAAAPDGVLDGRARGGLPRVRGTAAVGRGLHRLHRRPRARPLQGRAEDPRARHRQAREHHQPV